VEAKIEKKAGARPFSQFYSPTTRGRGGLKSELPTGLVPVEAEIEKKAGASLFLNLIHPRREVVGVWQKR